MMHRPSEHVYQYMLAELGTEGSIDAQQRLVIKGKFIPKVSHLLLLQFSSIPFYSVCVVLYIVH